jgi:hypothetical protein
MKFQMQCENGLSLLSLASKRSWFDGMTILIASAALFASMMLTLEGQHQGKNNKNILIILTANCPLNVQIF